MKAGGQAFPGSKVLDSRGFTLEEATRGMTLREYAAIKLRVPESGNDWLDDMIKKSKRDEFASVALPGLIGLGSDALVDEIAYEAYMYADAMLAKK